MKTDIKPKGLQGEGPPEDRLGKGNFIFVVGSAVAFIVVVAGLILWLVLG
jgi:hypothetical protein